MRWRQSVVLSAVMVLAGAPAPLRVGNPAWSPDGQWIAFTGTVAGESGIHVIHPDGTRRRLVPIGAVQPRWPAWSPDSMWLSFAGQDTAGDTDLYRVRLDGSGLTRLTMEHPYVGLSAWSPDGQQLAYYSGQPPIQDIFVVSRDGGEPMRLTDGTGRHDVPSWHPTRPLMLMGANRGTGGQVWTLDLVSRRFSQLTNFEAPARASAPRWSPDGAWISFESNLDGDWELYRMRADGSGLERLTHNETFDAMSSWSPDGRRLVYECWQGDEHLLCLIDLESKVASVLEVR